MIICFVSSTKVHHSLFADNISLYPVPMLVTVLLLSIGACWFGYLISELFLFTSYQGALFVHPDNLALFDSLGSLAGGLPLLTLLILICLVPLRSSYRLGLMNMNMN